MEAEEIKSFFRSGKKYQIRDTVIYGKDNRMIGLLKKDLSTGEGFVEAVYGGSFKKIGAYLDFIEYIQRFSIPYQEDEKDIKKILSTLDRTEKRIMLEDASKQIKSKATVIEKFKRALESRLSS